MEGLGFRVHGSSGGTSERPRSKKGSGVGLERFEFCSIGFQCIEVEGLRRIEEFGVQGGSCVA